MSSVPFFGEKIPPRWHDDENEFQTKTLQGEAASCKGAFDGAFDVHFGSIRALVKSVSQEVEISTK